MQLDGLVSIVIVAHNNWPDLELAIQSALYQSYPKIEVIVVDNSSRDETEQQVPKIFGNRLRYVRQPNTGEGGGRNTGTSLVAGEFIQFLDGDDFLAPNKIEKQIAAFSGAPDVDVVYGDARQFQSAAGFASWEDWDGQDYPDMLATLLSPDGNGCGLVVHSVLFRRKVLERVGPWLENFAVSYGPVITNMADQDYWLRAAWLGTRFRYCPGSLCFQRRRAGQLTSRRNDVVRGMESVFMRAREYIVEEPYRTLAAQTLARILFYSAVSEKGSSVQESMNKLRKAREASPDYVTSAAFAIGSLLIITRTGPLIFAKSLKQVRKFVAFLAGMKRRG